jgi:phenylacetate-CoA ligase
MGANLYPEDVAAGIGDSRAADVLGAFCMELAEIDDDEVRPVVHIEAPAAADVDPAEVAAAIRRRLATLSADFRAALDESPAAGDLRVRLWDPGTGPFAANAGRIKQRRVVPAVAR